MLFLKKKLSEEKVKFSKSWKPQKLNEFEVTVGFKMEQCATSPTVDITFDLYTHKKTHFMSF